MTFKLLFPFAADSAAHANDVRALKILLNRFGYYMPDDIIGISEFPDKELFAALKIFQKDHGLPQSGKINPCDKVEKTLNDAMEYAGKSGSYIWHTMRDNRVRPEHRAREGKIFSWSKPPTSGHPGEAPTCRCWAEPVKDAVNFKRSQLQRKFKHAEVFDIKGNPNNRTLEQFKRELEDHINSPYTRAIKGTLHRQKVTHYLNTKTKIDVIVDDNGVYISNWKLSDEQFENVMRSGKLGGGK